MDSVDIWIKMWTDTILRVGRANVGDGVVQSDDCRFKLTFCGNPSRGGHAPLQLEWGINNLGSAVNHAIKLSVVFTFWHNPGGGSLVRARATLAFVLGDNRAFSAAIMASSIKDDTDIHQLPPSPRTAAIPCLSVNRTPVR